MSLINFTDTLYVKGFQLSISVGQTSATQQLSFAFGTKIFGVKIFIPTNTVLGDYGEFKILNPADQSLISQFGETCYFPTTVNPIEVTVGKGGSEIPPGLIYNFDVHAGDALGRKYIFWLLLLK